VEALGPPQADANRQVARFRGVVAGARILRDVETGDADAATGAGHLHHLVQDRRRPLLTSLPSNAARLKPDAGDLMAQRHPHGCRGASTDHVLVRAADIGADDLHDHAMLAVAVTPLIIQFQLWEGNILNLNLPSSFIDNSSVLIRHDGLSWLIEMPSGLESLDVGSSRLGIDPPTIAERRLT
jgi:hypothetical protein